MASQSGIPVKVHLETQIQQDGQLEKHVFDEDGQVVKMGESLYLRYLEHGGEQATAVRFKLAADGQIQLTRGTEEDETQLRLYFKQGEDLGSIYQTKYGNMPVLTTTTHLLSMVKEQPVSGEITVHYQLAINNQAVGDYKLRLIFTA
ncbi:YwiB family protein [Latilactobacillus curvatus]